MTKALLPPSLQRFIFTGVGVLLAILAFLTPYWEIAEPASYVGGLLVWAALLEILHGFRRSENPARRSAWLSGGITLLIGIVMINAILFRMEALVNFIGILFLIEAIRYGYRFIKSLRTEKRDWSAFISAVGNGIIVLLIILFKGRGLVWVISISGTLRILGTIYNLFTAKLGTSVNVAEDIVASMGMKGNEEVEAMAKKIGAEDKVRSGIDAGWIITFIFILFFIHLGRMGFDQSASGMLSPIVAVIGDMFIALVVAFGVIAPLRTIFRQFARLFEKALWKWIQKKPVDERRTFSLRTLAMIWLERQMRLSISIRKSGYTFINAFRNGLKIGLPFSAFLAAIIPVLGMSWYFDTENWASGIWDGYASTRTEVWREAMLHATADPINVETFRLHPKGVTDSTDFSFVVIGDTGEGDPSQHILKDQLLAVSNKKDVKFVVISSDVIYPSGAMKDYERKFFLPFKGVTKPIYAIPGNHDWYDALDGFVATFYTPEMAKRAIEARVLSDLKFTSTTDRVIDGIIHQASILRKEYQVPVGYQNAPFFQISNEYFVFITVDTGVLRRVDNTQLAWIKSVLDASKGKFVMVLLGHPFYAIGEYQGDMNPDFKALHDLFRSYKVPLIMAGDTHDLEYYKEGPKNNDSHIMHHFVNGGGGAYLSIGAAMAPIDSRPTEDWAIYPSRGPLMHKIDSLTPTFKYPGWIWLKKYNGYPFSAEWLSAAFDYNQAPYFQSFMEIKVERSRNRIRLIPYGTNGQLHWRDLEYGGEGKPSDKKDADLAEWILPIRN